MLVWGDPSGPVANVPGNATNLIAVAGGDYRGLGLKRDGTVIAWGSSIWQLTGANLGLTNVPAGLSNVVSVAAGAGHTLALRADGTLAMWGSIIGNNPPLTPTASNTTISPDATNVVALAPGSGAWHAMVLRADGTVVDWGRTESSLNIVPPAARHVVAVSAGSWHAAALRADGRVVLWGDNTYGQTNAIRLGQPVVLPTNVVAIAASERGTAALCVDGTVVNFANGTLTTVPQVNDAIDIFYSFKTSGTLILRRNGTLTQTSGGPTIPSNATNISSIAGTGEHGIALLGTSSPVFPGLAVNRTVVSGARAYFRAVATGALPISYQWQREGTNIAGATNTVFAITNAQPNQMGAFTLIASNAFGVITNGAMQLTVLPVEIVQQPTNVLQFLGGNTSFKVAAEGQGPLSYQWFHNSRAISGATSATLSLSNLQDTNAGLYSVIVSNVHGFELSEAAQLTLQPFLVTNQPTNPIILIETNATFTVTVTGVQPISFQWQFNGSNLPETSSSLTLNSANLSNAGNYNLMVSNAYGVTNISFVLSVVPSFIVSPPTNQTIFRGGTISFNLTAKTLIPATYQWFHDGIALSDATNANVILTNAQRSMAGNYSVIFSNEYETLTNSAVLAVVDVAVWGFNGQAEVPVETTNIIAIAKGNSHSLALNREGEVIGWGLNSYEEATQPLNLTNCVSIAAGSSFSVGLQSDGKIVAWGVVNERITNAPTTVSNFVAIAAGVSHALALTSEGIVYAWGASANGETNVPAGLSNVAAISAGQNHNLALKSDGTVVAWGRNNAGQTNIPIGLSNLVRIAAGGNFNLALKADGSVTEWGQSSSVPIPAAATNLVAIAAGSSHALALRADGKIFAWRSSAFAVTNVPLGLTNVVAIAAHPNQSSSLALVSDGPPRLNAVLVGPFLGNDAASVTIPSLSGRVYRLEYTDSLASPTWTFLPLVAGNGTHLSLQDPTPHNGKERYYRVIRW